MKFFSSASLLDRARRGRSRCRRARARSGSAARATSRHGGSARSASVAPRKRDLNRSPVWGRLRLGIGLPAGLRLTVAGDTPARDRRRLGSAPERRAFQSCRSRELLAARDARIFAQDGTAEGDFTCSENDAAAAPGSSGNPVFFCDAPSDDEVTLAHYGAQLTARFDIHDRADVYFGVLAIEHDLELPGSTLSRPATLDRSLLLADGFTWGGRDRRRSRSRRAHRPGVGGLLQPSRRAARRAAPRRPTEILNVRGMLRFRMR